MSQIEKTILSPKFFLGHLPWRIMIKREDQYIGFHLQCNLGRKTGKWACSAVAELRLLSIRPNVKNVSRTITHVFNAKVSDWGYNQFVKWNNVRYAKNGFIKADTMTFEVHLKAEQPTGISISTGTQTDTFVCPTELLEEQFDCPICTDLMSAPIRMCSVGHNICNSCFWKFNLCPQCRSPMIQTRNFALEQLYDAMEVSGRPIRK